MILVFERDLMEYFLERLENCQALTDELVSSGTTNLRLLAAADDLLKGILNDFGDEIQTATVFDEFGDLLAPTLDDLTKGGYSYDQAEFFRAFLTDATDPNQDKTSNYFAIVTPFILRAYQCGKSGGQLEKLYPFIKRT